MNSSQTDPEFEALLVYLKHSRGCNLIGYKRSTLMRRFRARMQKIEIDNYQCYLQYLQLHSEEHLILLNDVLINFTSFFRDQEVWDYLATDIIPKIIASKQPDEPIRVWSAGCANGKESYSLLMLLAEALGIESSLKRVQGYATDADENALAEARKATYSDLDILSVPPDLLKKYFEQTQEGYVFHPQLRRTLIFGHHDLVQNAPMSKIDLLICRNVLIYFNREAQKSILIRFHFALKNTGFLLLGKSETLVSQKPDFTPINLKHRVYGKGLDLELDDHLSLSDNAYKSQSRNLLIAQNHFSQTAFEASPVAQLGINLKGCLMSSNDQANLLFGLTLDDVDRPFQELELGKQLAFHTALKRFYCNHRPVSLKNIEWVTSEKIQYFDMAIAPVFNLKQQFLGITLTFVDTTAYKRLDEKRLLSENHLANVSKTLQVTESELHTTLMELEAANQEIKILSQNIDSIN